MGEMAEAIAQGKCCQECMVYFVDKATLTRESGQVFTHGYPVLCECCFKSKSKDNPVQKQSENCTTDY